MELKSHSSKEREFGLVWSQLGYASYTKWGPARNPLLPDNMGMVSHICHLRQELAMWRKEDSWGPRASQPNLIRATGLRERLCLRKQSDTVAPKAVFCPPPTHTRRDGRERERRGRRKEDDDEEDEEDEDEDDENLYSHSILLASFVGLQHYPDTECVDKNLEADNIR